MRPVLVVALAAAAGACVGPGPGGQSPAPSAPSPSAGTTDHACAATAPAGSRFAFHSSFWLNLHNFLYREARLSRGVDDEGLLAAGNLAVPLAPLRALAPEEEAAWSAAVATYRDVAAGPLPDSVVIRVNNALARSTDPALADLTARPDMRAALLSVADLYREAWWPDHDRRNREWIADVERRLARFEACLAPALSQALGGAWPEGPLRVDATVYASWAAAYTTFDPSHITISSLAVGTQGWFGLETLLHEAGHDLMRPLEADLAAAARERGLSPDAQLAHLLLFYTAGEIVRRAVPDHPTAAEAFGIWRQNTTAARYHDALRAEWRPWLAGERSREDAVAALLSRPIPPARRAGAPRPPRRRRCAACRPAPAPA